MIRIGIDPGTDTGVSKAENGKLSVVTSLKILSAIRYVDREIEKSDVATGEKIIITIEDCTGISFSGKDSEAKKQNVGHVKRDCKIWKELATEYKDLKNVEFNFVKPVSYKKLTNGETKVNKKVFQKHTGWMKVTNQHGRDAAMLIYGV